MAKFFQSTDSNYRNALSEGVLRLQEMGKLSTMKIKWWKEKKGGGACAVSFLNFDFFLWNFYASRGTLKES